MTPRQWNLLQEPMPSIIQEFQMTECDVTGLRDKGRETASSFLLLTITSCCASNFSFFFFNIYKDAEAPCLEKHLWIQLLTNVHYAYDVPCSGRGPGIWWIMHLCPQGARGIALWDSGIARKRGSTVMDCEGCWKRGRQGSCGNTLEDLLTQT